MIGSVASAAPSKVNYQGRLFDAAGAPLLGPVDLVINLYDGPDPLADTLIATETHNGTPLVDGIYSIDLNVGEPELATDVRWIEVIVDGEALVPLQQFVSVPTRSKQAIPIL